MNVEHWIYLNQEKTEGVSVHLFDANHILGAAMILFRGKMGTILHTGDFRYTDRMLENPVLFPPHLKNERLKQIAIDIDQLVLDNTFCDPKFTHPSKVSLPLIIPVTVARGVSDSDRHRREAQGP